MSILLELGIVLCAAGRRACTYAEGRLIRAQRRISQAGALFIVLALALVGACGIERHVRSALDVAATAVDRTDDHVDDVYTRRSAEVLAAAETIEAYRESMRPLDAVEAALRVSRSVLLVAESGLDAHGAEGILPTLGCVALALERLSVALVDAGIDVPPKVTRALEAIGALTGANCNLPEDR